MSRKFTSSDAIEFRTFCQFLDWADHMFSLDVPSKIGTFPWKIGRMVTLGHRHHPLFFIKVPADLSEANFRDSRFDRATADCVF